MRRLRGLEALRLASKGLGDHVVYVNAAGCFTMLAAYPFTPFKGSWLYTTMGSAPAGAQGIRDALDVLIANGRVRKEENLKVVVLGGMAPRMTWRSPRRRGPFIASSIFITFVMTTKPTGTLVCSCLPRQWGKDDDLPL